jgi:hypothetical protein
VDSLAELADMGIDVTSLLEAEAEHDEGSRGAALGEEKSSLPLTEAQKVLLAHELCDLADRYDTAMEERHEREEEIRDLYAMLSDPAQSGIDASSSRLGSELMTDMCDTASARLQTNIMSVTPLIKVEPIKGSKFGSVALELSPPTEAMLNEYTLRGMDFKHLLPQAIDRATKVGTAVFRFDWQNQKKTCFYYTADSSEAKRETKEVGDVCGTLLANAHVKVWPPDLINWQSGYTFVGHEAFHSYASWRRLVSKFNLPASVVTSIEANPGEANEVMEKDAERNGIDAQQLRDERSKMGMFRLTELWCDMVLPGEDEPRKFVAILHRPSRQILWVDENPHHSQKHPYFPVRYKWADNSAWGIGVGHEIVFSVIADIALRNLQMDNLYAGAYSVILRKAGAMYNSVTDTVRPGMQIPVDDPDKDFIPRKLGGEAPELQMAIEDNRYRARQAAGLPPVMSGQGDPTMKSGAGTGSTIALIGEGNKKIARIDANMRVDLSEMYMFILELLAQYATDGLFYRWATDEDAQILSLLRWTPPRGEVGQMFQIRAQAPSASTSDESRRQAYMTLWGFAQAAAPALIQMYTSFLAQENPAAVPRYVRSHMVFLEEIARRIVEINELPGLMTLTPTLPVATPEDQIINDLNMQLQQLQQQLAEMQAAMQQPPMDPAMQGMPPEMMQGGPPMEMPGAELQASF